MTELASPGSSSFMSEASPPNPGALQEFRTRARNNAIELHSLAKTSTHGKDQVIEFNLPPRRDEGVIRRRVTIEPSATGLAITDTRCYPDGKGEYLSIENNFMITNWRTPEDDDFIIAVQRYNRKNRPVGDPDVYHTRFTFPLYKGLNETLEGLLTAHKPRERGLLRNVASGIGHLIVR